MPPLTSIHYEMIKNNPLFTDIDQINLLEALQKLVSL